MVVPCGTHHHAHVLRHTPPRTRAILTLSTHTVSRARACTRATTMHTCKCTRPCKRTHARARAQHTHTHTHTHSHTHTHTHTHTGVWREFSGGNNRVVGLGACWRPLVAYSYLFRQLQAGSNTEVFEQLPRTEVFEQLPRWRPLVAYSYLFIIIIIIYCLVSSGATVFLRVQ